MHDHISIFVDIKGDKFDCPSVPAVLEVKKKKTFCNPAQHIKGELRAPQGQGSGNKVLSIFKYIPGDNTESQVS